MLQGAGLTPADYRGDLIADRPPQDVTGDPDLLNLTRPGRRSSTCTGSTWPPAPTSPPPTRSPRPASARPTTACESLVREMNLRGAQLARQAADEAGGQVRRRLGRPAQRHPVAVAARSRTRPTARSRFDQVRAALRGADRGARRGRRRPAADRDDLRHAQRQGRDRRRPRGRPAPAAVDLGDDRRPERPHAVRADRRGVLALDRARRAAGRRRELLARRGRDAPARRRAGPARRHLRRLPPQRRPAQRVRRLRRDPGGDRPSCSASSPAPAWSTSSAAAAAPPRRTSRRSPRRSGAARRATVADAGRATRFSGLEPFEIGPDTGFVMIGERTNVTGSAKFRRLIEADDYQAAVDVALEQVRGGANLLDVNMDADLLDSEQAMTTFLNLIATEPEVARIPVMIDSSQWSVLEAGLKCVQGKGVVNSISLKEGEEPFLDAGPADPRLRRRRRRDGLRRAGPGRHHRAQGRDLRPRLRPAHPARPGSPPEDIIFDPNVLAVATGIAEHNGYAKAFIDALPLIKQRCPGARTSGGISNLSFSFRGNDVVREAMHSAFLFHAVRAGPGHGHRQRRPARRLPGHPGRPAGTGRGRAVRPARRTPPTGWSPSPRTVTGSGTKREVDLSWREAPVARAARRTRWCTASSTSSRRTPRRPAQQAGPAARRDRGPADGRHEGRRRPVRRRQDVPAAGGQERPGDEALGRLPRAVHGGREGAGPPGGRAHAARAGQGRAGHGQGRRARHRQEHRRRGAGLQQLRGDRPRRDGAGREDPGHRGRRGRRRRSACPG